MRVILMTAMLAVSLPVLAQEAKPEETPTAEAMIKADFQQVAKLLTEEGYKAKVETSERGQQYIKSSSGGRNFTVSFLGCSGGVKAEPCTSVEFYTGFTHGKPYPIERTNEWNRKSRYGRAYVDSDNDPVVEMDLLLEPTGMPQRLFVENLKIWFDIMADFDDFVFEDTDAIKKKE